MHITLDIKDKLLEQAAQLTGIKDNNELVRMGLELLVTRESAKRLATLGGTEKGLIISKRRNTDNL